MTDVFIVSVEGNLVTGIESSPSTSVTPGTPLEVGTQLATAFRETGRLDGDYVFADREGARTFAKLCLQFMKNLVEQRTRLVEALPPDFAFYRENRGPGIAGNGEDPGKR
jgi:hypothetical protein